MADGSLVLLGRLDPPLKWAGGKRWFVQRFKKSLDLGRTTLIEPFAGSAAVFFATQPKSAVLSDLNQELMSFYTVLRDSPDALERALKRHAVQHSSDYYYSIRAQVEKDPLKRAARTLYLNRTCWNALYRVNLKGEFNVPKGTKDKVVLETDNFWGWATLLSRAKILSNDFEAVVDGARRGQFIFADPPYRATSNPATFAKYNASVFTWSDQVRLRDALVRADKRGVRFMLTNVDTPELRDLYREVGDLWETNVASVISGSNKGRNSRRELIWANVDLN